MAVAILAATAVALVADRAPARAADAPENVTFYYQELRPTDDISVLGNPEIVVLGPQDAHNESVAAARVHSIGAKAYRYVQFYWLPAGRTYQGVDLADHPDWGFCRNGSTSAQARISDGLPWYHLDLNERGARDAMLAFTNQVKAWGYDGVMIDRGHAALISAKDASGTPIWNRVSTCTEDPIAPGRTFADAYVGMTASVKGQGLEVMFNYATSPNDAKLAMRPNPADPKCDLPTTATAPKWAQCSRKDDVWPFVDSVLIENFGKETDSRWVEDWRTGSLAEARKQKIVALLKVADGEPSAQRARAYYQWAKVKLFPTSAAINMGDDRCLGRIPEVCQRNGLFPELTSIQLGPPNRGQPIASQCMTATRCVYTRTYQRGTVVANASPRTGVAPVLPPAHQNLVDRYTGRVVTHDSCGAGVPQPAWSGRVFVAEPRSPATVSRRGAVIVDGWGGVHSFAVGSCAPAPAQTNGGPYWVGWDIVRGVSLLPGSTGGYILDGYGGLHAFGVGTNPRPPAARFGPYWRGRDLARDVALLPDGTGGYVLDGAGGLHAFAVGNNPRPPAARFNAYWPGWDIARGVAILPDGSGGYVVDAWGGIHRFAIGSGPLPPPITGGPYWVGWDIVRGLAFVPGGHGGYVLDGWGGLHPLPGTSGWRPPSETTAPYWPGWSIAKGLAIATG